MNAYLIKCTLKLQQVLSEFKRKQGGMGTIEMVLLVAILIGLAFLLNNFLRELFDKVTVPLKDKVQVDTLINP